MDDDAEDQLSPLPALLTPVRRPKEFDFIVHGDNNSFEDSDEAHTWYENSTQSGNSVLANQSAASLERYMTIGDNVNSINSDGYTLQHLSVLYERLDVLERQCSSGFDVDVYALDGFTALMLACCLDREQCARVLLENNADPYFYVYQGTMCGILAAAHGSQAVQRVLHEFEVDFDLYCSSSLSPLIAGCQCNQVEAVKFLLELGLSMDIPTMRGRGGPDDGFNVLLLWCAKLEHKEIIEVLLDAGVSIETRDSCSYTVAHVLAEAYTTHQDTPFTASASLSLDFDYEDSENSYCMTQSEFAHPAKTQQQEPQQLPAQWPRYVGQSVPLIAAFGHKRQPALAEQWSSVIAQTQMLLARGMRVTVQNDRKLTALTVAVQRNNLPVLLTFLGITVNLACADYVQQIESGRATEAVVREFLSFFKESSTMLTKELSVHLQSAAICSGSVACALAQLALGVSPLYLDSFRCTSIFDILTQPINPHLPHMFFTALRVLFVGKDESCILCSPQISLLYPYLGHTDAFIDPKCPGMLPPNQYAIPRFCPHDVLRNIPLCIVQNAAGEFPSSPAAKVYNNDTLVQPDALPCCMCHRVLLQRGGRSQNNVLQQLLFHEQSASTAMSTALATCLELVNTCFTRGAVVPSAIHAKSLRLAPFIFCTNIFGGNQFQFGNSKSSLVPQQVDLYVQVVNDQFENNYWGNCDPEPFSQSVFLTESIENSSNSQSSLDNVDDDIESITVGIPENTGTSIDDVDDSIDENTGPNSKTSAKVVPIEIEMTNTCMKNSLLASQGHVTPLPTPNVVSELKSSMSSQYHPILQTLGHAMAVDVSYLRKLLGQWKRLPFPLHLSLNSHDNTGLTLLQKAVKGNLLQASELLIKFGADIDLRPLQVVPVLQFEAGTKLYKLAPPPFGNTSVIYQHVTTLTLATQQPDCKSQLPSIIANRSSLLTENNLWMLAYTGYTDELLEILHGVYSSIEQLTDILLAATFGKRTETCQELLLFEPNIPVATPNALGLSPMQIAQRDKNEPLIELFRLYVPQKSQETQKCGLGRIFGKLIAKIRRK